MVGFGAAAVDFVGVSEPFVGPVVPGFVDPLGPPASASTSEGIGVDSITHIVCPQFVVDRAIISAVAIPFSDDGTENW